MGAELAIAGLGAALGIFSSVNDAKKQNKAVRESKAAARNAAEVQGRQLTEQEAQQRAIRIQEARRVRANILAAGGASGFDLSSGDFADATFANEAFASQDLETLATNLRSSLDRMDSGLNSQIVEFNTRRQSVAGSALTGGLSGLSSGLSLGQNVNSIIRDPNSTGVLSIRKGPLGPPTP